MTPSYRIVFYISGHGFGHASRSREVIRALLQQRPDVSVIVKTSVPGRLFPSLEVLPFESDTGMLQRDSLHVDVTGSIARAVAFHANIPQKGEAEARFLNERDVNLVLGDIPPLAFAAAAAAGLPSVAIGNFTWDWIYAGYPGTPAPLLQQIRAAYSHADLALRLPMSGGFDGLESKTRDVPFVACTSQRDAGDVRRAHGIPEDKPMVLTSFGAYGLQDFDAASLDGLHGYTVFTAESAAPGFEYQDLVRAADVVVTKPGYGIISECIANDTAILYTSRGDFPEYEVLVREMPRYLRAQFIAQDDLLAGRWAPSLEKLLSSPPPPIRPAVNGAAVAAEEILAFIS